MQPHCIPYAATGRFTKIVLDHLEDAPALREHSTYRPDLSGLRAAAADRQVDCTTRAVFVEALWRQYADLPSHAVQENIALLARADALTVTTGHQLVLFGGPLYVPFKILNTIRLARTLSEELDRPVIPIFWMASEDHDREEVDHTYFNGQRIQWTGPAGGPVGRMKLHGIDAVVTQAVEHLGIGADADGYAALLRDCYTPDRTLAEATRRFFHALYGRFGLVILDADDAALKRCFAPIVQEEVLNQVVQRTVNYANARLEVSYPVQAHAREINLFHLRPGHRSRITLVDDHYQVLDGEPKFSADELLHEVATYPERFSPNVLLRPVYQECILPNVAYIGGGGELAYWFQLRWLFQGLQVPMPALVLRTSAAMISGKLLDQWAALGLTHADLFAEPGPLQARIAAAQASFPTDVDQELSRLNAFYDALLEKAVVADPTLQGAVDARRASAVRGVERMGKAMVRAAKRDQATVVRRMETVHQAVFPGGGLQERKENVLPMLSARGQGLLDELLEILDPLKPCFTILQND